MEEVLGGIVEEEDIFYGEDRVKKGGVWDWGGINGFGKVVEVCVEEDLLCWIWY